MRNMRHNRPSIYLASPLFSSIEKVFNRELCDKMREFSDVYLPQDDGALLIDLLAEGMSIIEAKQLVFTNDIRAIEKCDILVFVMDGRVLDEGACFELGYAYARGKICVGLKSDVRSLLPVGDNPMIECALRNIFREPDELFSWLRQGTWTAFLS